MSEEFKIPKMPRCSGKTKSGLRCKRKAWRSWGVGFMTGKSIGYCKQHEKGKKFSTGELMSEVP